MEEIKTLYSNYLTDPSYVYKSCGQYIVILKKIAETKTNEQRKSVANARFAKFRASCLECILIFDKHKPQSTISETNNTAYSNRLCYKVGMIVYPDSFDENLDKICSNGCHYFNSIDRAYYYETSKLYTEYIFRWHDDGSKESDGCCISGKRHGPWTIWRTLIRSSFRWEPIDTVQPTPKFAQTTYINNVKHVRTYEKVYYECKSATGNYIDGIKTGRWTVWHVNYSEKSEYRKRSEGLYDIHGLKTGVWTYWSLNGNKVLEGEFSAGKQTGMWVELYPRGTKKVEGEYIEGMKEGHWITFHPNGCRLSEGEFISNKENGYWIYWNLRGMKISEGEYLDGKKCGVWNYWDSK